MSNFKNRTLCLAVKGRFEYIDGTHLHNESLISLRRLNTFTFHIVSIIQITEGDHRKSVDDIQNTFTHSKFNQAKCYVNYFNYRLEQCHIYLEPFTMTHVNDVAKYL